MPRNPSSCLLLVVTCSQVLRGEERGSGGDKRGQFKVLMQGKLIAVAYTLRTY